MAQVFELKGMRMTGLSELAGIAKPIVKTASNLIEKLAGRPCEIAGEMLADQLYMWQWQQRIRIFHRAEEVMKNEGIAARTIPSGFLIPLLNAVGSIEEDELQQLWSNLIASAAESNAACEASFIETLKGLSVREARLLRMVAREKVMATSIRATTDQTVECAPLPKDKFDSLGFADSEEFWSSASRLQSLGVLVLDPISRKSVRKTEDDNLGYPMNKEIAKRTKVQLRFTRFGARLFAKASREEVIDDSITDPWVGMSDIREIAMDAGQAASSAISIDQVEDRIDKNFRDRIKPVDLS
jgi:hypothetical protein